MEIDWGDGEYERTAATLMPVAEVLLDAARVAPGQRLLDVACGTGNVALAAAARGLDATGVDASEGLVALARARAAREGVAADFLAGDATRLPLPDARFDATVSAFGVIFAPDPSAAVTEMLRVTRPGGVVALTSWCASGPIVAAGGILSEAFPEGDGTAQRWDDPWWIRALLGERGARDVRVDTHRIAFTAASPEAWIAEEEEHHPIWRWARRRLEPAVWEGLRGRILATLQAGNEDRDGFRTTSDYLVVAAAR